MLPFSQLVFVARAEFRLGDAGQLHAARRAGVPQGPPRQARDEDEADLRRGNHSQVSTFSTCLQLSVVDLPDPDPSLSVRIRIIPSSSKNRKKPRALLFCAYFMTFLSLKNDIMYVPSKSYRYLAGH